jgi:predicted O-methyltransferase YrrM
MSEEQWTEVDRYFSERLLGNDPSLDSAMEAAAAAGLPPIAVSPNQGKLLQMLARIVDATSILEVGTLAGYSTIWLARALKPGGRLVTLEIDPKHAEVARSNIKRAALDAVVEIRVGSALDTLPELAAERRRPFDFIFIDADKQNIPTYFEWALKLSRPGTLIVVDNVVRGGAVIDAQTQDPSVQGVQRFVEMLGGDTRASGTAIQTVGLKGYDGFAIVLVDVNDTNTE